MAASLLAAPARAQSAQDFDARGNAFRAQGDHEKALFEYNRAVAMAPNVARYYYDRGRNHLDKDDRSWALADFDQAIRLDPADRRAHLARGAIRFAEAHFADAATDFAAALAEKPGDGEATLWLRAARARAGAEDPIYLARAIDELNPDPCDRTFFAGEMEVLQGKPARLHFEHAVGICAPDRLARTGALAEARRARQ